MMLLKSILNMLEAKYCKSSIIWSRGMVLDTQCPWALTFSANFSLKFIKTLRNPKTGDRAANLTQPNFFSQIFMKIDVHMYLNMQRNFWKTTTCQKCLWEAQLLCKIFKKNLFFENHTASRPYTRTGWVPFESPDFSPYKTSYTLPRQWPPLASNRQKPQIWG